MHATPPKTRPFPLTRKLSVRTLIGTVGRATGGVVTVVEVVRHFVRPGPHSPE